MFTKTSTTQYRQVTEVKNTHVYPVKIQLEEQLPRSETDKIKVSCYWGSRLTVGDLKQLCETAAGIQSVI